MYVLGIDGATRSGYSVFKISKRKIELIQYGVIQLESNNLHYLTILPIRQYLKYILSSFPFSYGGIEEIFALHGKVSNQKTFKFLAKLQIILEETLHDNNIPFADPVPVNTWRLGDGMKEIFNMPDIDKISWRNFVRQLVGNPKLDDNEADAIGIGLYIIIRKLNYDLKIDYSKAQEVNYGIKPKATSERKPKKDKKDTKGIGTRKKQNNE